MARSIRALAAAFRRDERGATTTEYGIILVVVAGVAIFALTQLNGAMDTLYGKFASKVPSND